MTDSTPQASPTTELSYDQALQLAIKLHRAAQLEPAESLYRTLLKAARRDPNPLHYLGVLLHQRGRGDEGLEFIRQSLLIDPTVASWQNNLGNVLLDRGELEAAMAAYARCTELDSNNAEVLNNLGVMLRNLKRYAEAEEVLKRALEKNPTFASAHTNLASVYYEQKRIKEGHEHIAVVLAQEPGDATARKVLGLLYASLGRLEEAAEIFRAWLVHEPQSEQAKHHLAACSRQQMPDRATEGYVEQVFDSFAGSFDAKLATLEYRAPQFVGETLASLLGTPQPRFRLIDAGCGTGLCAPYLAPYAQSLVGVDLSSQMMERARARNHYTALIKADLVAYLTTCDADQDAIVSADTLCYFGRLDPVAVAARRALRSGGYLVFTVEAHEAEEDFRLNPHGRYSHRAAYVRSALEGAGFRDITMKEVCLRNEGGQPVEGWIVSAVNGLVNYPVMG